jgi:hypothetical protein
MAAKDQVLVPIEGLVEYVKAKILDRKIGT